MFNNPQTLWIEILVVALVVTFLAVVLGRYIYIRKSIIYQLVNANAAIKAQNNCSKNITNNSRNNVPQRI